MSDNDTKTVDDVNVNTETNNDNENGTQTKTDYENTDSNKTVPLATLLKYKDELKTVKEELQSIKDLQQEAEEAKLKEQNNYKELLTKKEQEFEGKLAEANNKLAELEPDATAYKSLRDKEIEECKVLLGEDWDDSMKTLPIATLRNIVKRTVPESALDTDTGGKKKNIKNLVDQLTDKEKKDAARKNLTLEDYVEVYKVKKE